LGLKVSVIGMSGRGMSVDWLGSEGLGCILMQCFTGISDG
jgi:hypothetical protein